MSDCAATIASRCFGFELSDVCRMFPRALANATASAIKSFVSILTGEKVDKLDALFIAARLL